jgi:hypothetical protein
MAVFGQILQKLMERAEIAGPAELVEKTSEAGNELVSEEELLGMMYDDLSEEEMPFRFFRSAQRILGANKEEWGILCVAFFKSHTTPEIRGYDLRWQLERAMRRREHFGPAKLEELTEEEADSEQRVWWKASKGVADAAYTLKGRWVHEEEGEELIRELEAIEEKLAELGRSVTRHHQRLFTERVPLDEYEDEEE